MLKRLQRYLRSGSFMFGILSGLLFLLFFQLRYAELDPGAYQYRDDGIITLSHAKNFVEHGHIGVDPSGKRIEGFSAPLQFWIYTEFYALTGMHWLDFATLQTLLCTFLLGFFFVQFFKGRWIGGLLVSAGAAWFLSLHLRFLEWHGSGMENAWTHVFVLLSVLLCWKMFLRESLNYWWVIWIFLASVSRIEGIFHIGPVLLLFAFAWRGERKSWRGFAFLGLFLGLWGLYQAWRYWYFGSFLPNTGAAQGISVAENLGKLRDGDAGWLNLAGAWSQELFRLHGGWFLIGGLLLLPFAKVDRREKWVLLAVASLALTAFLNPLVFGMTRLDVTRSTTFLAVAVALGLAMVAARLRYKGLGLAALPLLLGLLLAARFARPLLLEEEAHLCCAIDEFEDFHYYASRFSDENDLHRLNMANPDLGKLSYLKQYNFTDLGFLGSPLMAELRGHSDWMREYFYGFVQPDVVEVHGGWCVEHARILADARFSDLYEPIYSYRGAYLEEFAEEWPSLEEGMFQRKGLKVGSGGREGDLIRSLKADLSLGLLDSELGRSVDKNDPRAHQYVVRTAYRFLPEFRDAGLEEELVDLFRETPSAAFDVALLESGGRRGWVKDCMGFLEPFLAGEELSFFEKLLGVELEAAPELMEEHWRWRLYKAPGNRLVFSVLSPTAEDRRRQMLLHVFDADKDAALKKNEWGVDFMDFSWDADCWAERNGEYFTVVELPPGDLEAVMVGQVSDGTRLWWKRLVWD